MDNEELAKKQALLEKQFPVGTIVKLKSGGPEMTVQDHSATTVYAQWFAGKKLENGRFPGDSLIIVSPPAEAK